MFSRLPDGGFFLHRVFFFRSCQNWGNRASFSAATGPSLLASTGRRSRAFYTDNRVHAHPAVRGYRGPRIAGPARTITTRRSGDPGGRVGAQALTQARTRLANAREGLVRSCPSASKQRLLAALAGPSVGIGPPRRIEVYDNSHYTGTNAVGAMIVADPSAC